MYNKILVPLDGSELAEVALESATLIAQKQAGQLITLTVPSYGQFMAPSPAGYAVLAPPQIPEILTQDANKYLEAIYQTYHASGFDFDTRVISGDIASTIVDLAIAEDVDLITMTTHGYSGITRWMLGSVTERVLRNAPCPVLVVRCEGLPKNAVITLDGSELSESALSPGLTLARLVGADVTLLFVDQTKKLGDLELNLLDAAGAGLGKQIAQEDGDSNGQYLRNIVEKYQAPSQEINSLVLGGPPAAAILDYVEREPVDLLIMATHGHTGLRRWVYGSVTEKCLHNTACAMLIVRPDKERMN